MKSLLNLQEKIKEVVIGQDEAVKVLSTSVYKYLLRMCGRDFGYPPKTASTILLLGKTGVGKTHLVKTVAEVSNLAFIEIDVKDIGMGGSWRGDTLDSLLIKGIDRFATMNEYKNGGIIYLDEFDKICQAQISTDGNDVNKQVQSTILRTIESIEFNAANRRLNTSNFLFVLSGAFSELHIKASNKIGFNNQQDSLPEITESLVKYGVLPEIMGRVQDYVKLKELTRKDYSDILRNKDFVFNSWNVILKKLDIDLELMKENVIDNVLKKDLGVRGLIQEVEKKVTEVMNDNIEKIDIERLSPLYIEKKGE